MNLAEQNRGYGCSALLGRSGLPLGKHNIFHRKSYTDFLITSNIMENDDVINLIGDPSAFLHILLSHC